MLVCNNSRFCLCVFDSSKRTSYETGRHDCTQLKFIDILIAQPLNGTVWAPRSCEMAAWAAQFPSYSMSSNQPSLVYYLPDIAQCMPDLSFNSGIWTTLMSTSHSPKSNRGNVAKTPHQIYKHKHWHPCTHTHSKKQSLPACTFPLSWWFEFVDSLEYFCLLCNKSISKCFLSGWTFIYSDRIHDLLPSLDVQKSRILHVEL